MADHAVGRPCVTCGTLVAMSGDYGDEQLAGACACCNTTNVIPNDQYVAPSPLVDLIRADEKLIDALKTEDDIATQSR